MLYVGLTLIWMTLLVKVPAVVRGWRDWGLLSYYLAVLGLAVCLTVDRTPIYLAVTQLTGVPNLAHGISYAAAIGGGFFGQLFLLNSYDRCRYKRELPWRVAVLTTGLSAYAVLFALGPAVVPNHPDVPHVAAAGPAMAAFRLVLAVMVCGSLTEVSVLAWRFSALAAHPPLRAGMRFVSLGCALITLRLAVEYGAFPVWSAASGWRSSWSYSGALYALNLLAVAASALVALGTVLPALARRWDAVCVARVHRQAAAQLAGLWSVMRTVTPALSNVTKGARRTRFRLNSKDLLYRIVAEIRDGYVVLWPYRDGSVEDDLRRRGSETGLLDRDLDAFVDAGSLHRALDARTANRRAIGQVETKMSAGGDSFQAEVDYLLAVAQQWNRLGIGGRAAVHTSRSGDG